MEDSTAQKAPIKIIIIEPDQKCCASGVQEPVAKVKETKKQVNIYEEGNLRDMLLQLVLLGKDTEVLLAQNDALQTALRHQREALLQLQDQQQLYMNDLEAVSSLAQEAAEGLQKEAQLKQGKKSALLKSAFPAGDKKHASGSQPAWCKPVVCERRVVIQPPETSMNSIPWTNMNSTPGRSMDSKPETKVASKPCRRLLDKTTAKTQVLVKPSSKIEHATCASIQKRSLLTHLNISKAPYVIPRSKITACHGSISIRPPNRKVSKGRT